MALRRYFRSLAAAPLLLVLTVSTAHAEPASRSASVRSTTSSASSSSKQTATPRAASLARPSALHGVTSSTPHGAMEAPVSMNRAAARSYPRSSGRPATPSLDHSVSPTEARHELLSVRNEVARRARAGQRPIVIFDIDDTLLSWPRADQPKREPVPGALHYLVSLKQAGAKIVYITGRDEHARADTITDLREHGFPISSDEHLVLNDMNLKTIDFKTEATRSVVRRFGQPVAAFDNEKENARMFRRELPHVAVVRLRTTSQRPDSGGDGPITVIDDFTPAQKSGSPAPKASATASAAGPS